MAAPTYYTADMVWAMADNGNRYETLHGELVVTLRLWKYTTRLFVANERRRWKTLGILVLLLDFYDHLPEPGIRLYVNLGLGDLCKWKDAVQYGVQAPFGEQWEDCVLE